MITKEILDKHIENDYDRLIDIIQGMVYKYRSDLDATYILSMAYEDVLKKKDKIEPNKISHFITAFARFCTYYDNNPANRLSKFNYTDKTFINSFTQLIDEGIEDHENYFSGQSEIFKDEAEINIHKMIKDYQSSLNIIDKTLCDNLYEYIIDKKKVKLDEIYGCTKKDGQLFKRRLNTLFINFLDYVEDNKNIYKI